MKPGVWVALVAVVVMGLAPSASPISIPFELVNRHVVVKVTVEKSRPLSFVLDTGADLAIIRTDVARQLGLALEGTVNAGGAGPGTQTGSRVKNASWSLAGLAGFSQPLAFALPLPQLSPAMGRDIDGIIGGTFIKQFVLELDYEARTLTLHDRATFTYSGRGETLPLEFAEGHPIVHATVTPVGGQPLERRFALDIGSGAALILHTPFVAEQHLPGPDLPTIRAIGGAGAGGRSVGRMGRVASLQLGSFALDHPITTFSQDTGGAFANPALAGNIGAQVMNRFRSFFDYERRRLILEPNDRLRQPFDRAFSGISVRAFGPDYGTIRVSEVQEDSPASETGLKEGDVILSIDGRPARELTLTTIIEMFEKPLTYALEVQRGQQITKVTLTPRKLI